MSARIITATVPAWISRYNSPNELLGESSRAICAVNLTTADMRDHCWTRVGVAEVTLTLEDEIDVTKNRVEALRIEQKNIRADATAKVTDIEREIQQLLAIDHTPAADDDGVPF